MIKPLVWNGSELVVLDQLKLPHEQMNIPVCDVCGVIRVIKDMNVRGAPCIGFAGLFGVAFIVRDFDHKVWSDKASKLISARPTAVNLEYEVSRAMKIAIDNKDKMDSYQLFNYMIEFTLKTIEEAEAKHQEMAHWGEVALRKYVPHKNIFKLQTHCNTGELACGTLGTALGVIVLLARKNKVQKVWVDETRPYLQGSRLTAFELMQDNIPCEIVVEGAASHLMRTGEVDAIFVGADRIAANGDTANKIGTANLAIIAKEYGIPFFVVAPLSSFDFSITSGHDIEIEGRDENEILSLKDSRIAPYGATAFNPSFDITEAKYITAIICEKGIVDAPTIVKLQTLLRNEL